MLQEQQRPIDSQGAASAADLSSNFFGESDSTFSFPPQMDHSKPINIPNFGGGASSQSHPHSYTFDSFEDYRPSGRNSPANPYTPSYCGSFNSYGSGDGSHLDFGGRAQQHQGHSPHVSMLDDLGFGDEGEYDHRDYDAHDESNTLFLLHQHDDSALATAGSYASQGFQSQQDQGAGDLSEHRDYSAPSPASSTGYPDDVRRSPGSSIGLHSPAFQSSGDLPIDMNPLSFDNNQNDRSSMPPELRGSDDMGSPMNPSFYATISSPTSPTSKPQSPPALVIPDTPSQNSGASLLPPSNPGLPSFESAQRSMLGGRGQPFINIVPSTPVSGGANANPAGGFQDVLKTLVQGRGTGGQSAHAASQGLPRLSSLNPASVRGPATNDVSMFEPSGNTTTHTGLGNVMNAANWPPMLGSTAQGQGGDLASSSNRSGGAPPALPHPLSHSSFQGLGGNFSYLSGTSTAPASAMNSFNPSGTSFNANSLPQAMEDSSYTDLFGLAPPAQQRVRSKSDTGSRPMQWPMTVNPTDVLPSIFATEHQSPQPQHPSLQHYNTTGSLGVHYADSSSGSLLDINTPVSLRRSRSEGHRRAAKSEDLSAQRRLSPNDFLRSITSSDGTLAPPDPRSSPLGTDGSVRSRRGSNGHGHERGSSLSSTRGSPYPRLSPNSSPGASPAMTPHALPVTLHVERDKVTTPATRIASANRRRGEANFVCPVPGCGSTFTRHFNLRGHLRSHNEERPFKCKWPGCEKGFARQHDCKRHEALHLNLRPYTCEGCSRTFARMDALNRHLRSEGGADCQRVQQIGDDGNAITPNSPSQQLEQDLGRKGGGSYL